MLSWQQRCPLTIFHPCFPIRSGRAQPAEAHALPPVLRDGALFDHIHALLGLFLRVQRIGRQAHYFLGFPLSGLCKQLEACRSAPRSHSTGDWPAERSASIAETPRAGPLAPRRSQNRDRICPSIPYASLNSPLLLTFTSPPQVVSYIYFTRIVVYLLKSTTPYQYVWLSDCAGEMATLAFYCFTGCVRGVCCRPSREGGCLVPRAAGISGAPARRCACGEQLSLRSRLTPLRFAHPSCFPPFLRFKFRPVTHNPYFHLEMDELDEAEQELVRRAPVSGGERAMLSDEWSVVAGRGLSGLLERHARRWCGFGRS